MILTRSFIPGVYTTSPLMPYEQETVGNSVYSRYTDGLKWKDHRRLEKVPTKEVIFKTTTEGSIVRNEKTWDFWDNRTSAEYIPVNNPFKEDGTTFS